MKTLPDFRALLFRGMAALALFAWLSPGGAFAQNAFSFTDQSNVFAARPVTSAPVTLTGIGAGLSAAVTVSGGTYSIGCAGPWVSTAGSISDGQSVCVRQVSSPVPGGSADTVLTVGALSDTFTSTTAPSNAVALIAGYYRSILRREADAAGLSYWQGEAARLQPLGVDINETWRAMALAFFGSAEYRAYGRGDAEYVVDLYNTFFNRPPDDAGVAYWTGQIASGIPREGILLSFLFSTEFSNFTQALFGPPASRAETDLVVDFYRGLLDRLPDTEGFNYWRGRFRDAQCLGTGAVLAEVDAITTLFAASAEYLARNRTDPDYITDLYDGFLRRGGDLAGFQYWAKQLGTGSSRDQVRRAFMSGTEFQARVARVVAQPCLPLLAKSSNVVPVTVTPGVSPFIGFVDLQGAELGRISSVRFTIASKPGAASRPVSASFSTPYLARAGYASPADGRYRLPVFGLYAGYANQVVLDIRFDDGSVKSIGILVQAPALADPASVYANPNVLVRRAQGDPLGFDYVYLKSGTAPVVIDTDGELRWTVPVNQNTFSSFFDGAGFVIGSPTSMNLRRIGLDGAIRDYALAAPFKNFHHNFDEGKVGTLGEVDEIAGPVVNLENILVEFDADGQVLKQWNVGDILSGFMASLGDDPTLFVRPGKDWLHMNAAAYDPRDDSIVISGREDFVIKIDYQTGAPLWILGDPTKYWYTFPSLRSLSLSLAGGGLYPIGQHGISIRSDGTLLLFNNGIGSLQQPAGAPAGETRTYSAVSGYAIDPVARTAQEVFHFDYGRTILSNFCSSAYEAGDRSLLVNYAYADGGIHARIVGLDPASRVVFDFQYPSQNCQFSWNGEPIPFENLEFR
jgi:hypothetical protein